MTVSTSYTPISVAWSSTSQAISITWPFFTGTLVVTEVSSTGVETVKTLTTHYTVSGGTDANGLPAVGTVTMVGAATSGSTLRVTRSTPRTQATALPTAGAFPAKSVEAMADRLTLIAQENAGGGAASDEIAGDVMTLVTSGATDYWDGESHVIRNLDDGEQDTDAATVGQLNAAVENVVITENGEFVDFQTRTSAAAATIVSSVTAVRTRGYAAGGDQGGALYQKHGSSTTGGFQSADGAYWRVRPGTDGYVTPQMFGAVADYSGGAGTDNTTAFNNALASGFPVRVPAGSYLIDYITMPSNSVLVGEPGATIYADASVNLAILGQNVSDIAIRGISLIASPDAPDTTPQSHAIFLDSVTDFVVADVTLEGWADAGISCIGDAAQDTQRGVIERVRTTGWQNPSRGGSAGVALYQYTSDITIQNCMLEARCAYPVRIQDTVGTTTIGSTMTGHRVDGNTCRNGVAYGVMVYDPAVTATITGAANNGSGLIRITAASHGLTTGDEAMIYGVTGTVEANGLWTVTVITSSTFDLQSSTFANAYVSGGTVAYRDSNNVTITGNTIEDIDGDPAATENAGNGSFGAGIYCVGGGNVVIANNVIRRTNTGTTTQSLAPAGIGISSIGGSVLVDGNLIEDCEWFGIYNVTLLNENIGATVITGNTVRSCKRTGIYAYGGNAVIVGNHVTGRNAESLSVCMVASGATMDGARNYTISGNVLIGRGVSRPLTVATCSRVSVSGNVVRNGIGSDHQMAYFDAVDSVEVVGNVFDAGVSTQHAVLFNAITNSRIIGNRFIMTDSGAARACVSITGTCTGTIYDESNSNAVARMNNASTGGQMITSGTSGTDGGQTRQNGDVIINSSPAAGAYGKWIRIGGSWIGSDWISGAPFGLQTYTVATLPAGSAAQIAYASDGRKNGEGAGAGTGVVVFKDGTAWRACDTGATVAA